MPYIPSDRRSQLNIEPISKEITTPGELNYVISALVNNYLKKEQLRYVHINTCIGILECAKLELYRIVASKYEDGLKNINGGVYDKFNK